VCRPVVLASVAEQASTCGWQADGVDKVFQGAVLHIREGTITQRLFQKKANQWGLEGLVAKLAQGLQDACDPQVVVVGSSIKQNRRNVCLLEPRKKILVDLYDSLCKTEHFEKSQ